MTAQIISIVPHLARRARSEFWDGLAEGYEQKADNCTDLLRAAEYRREAERCRRWARDARVDEMERSVRVFGKVEE